MVSAVMLINKLIAEHTKLTLRIAGARVGFLRALEDISNAKTEAFFMTEYEIDCRVAMLMKGLKARVRAHHFCSARIHVVIFTGNHLKIIHSLNFGDSDFKVFMVTDTLGPLFLSQSQRETVQNRLKNLLKGSS